MIVLLKKHISLKNASVGVLGLAFKAGTDDVRDSVAVKVVSKSIQKNIQHTN